MKKQSITFLPILLLCLNCSAQKITPFALSSGGGYYKNSSYSNSWTIGQLVTATKSSATRKLTQGFQQPCRIQTISLASGWNMISGYVIPDVPAMTNVFKTIVSKIILVKNNAGQSYIPAFNINTIGNWDYKQGYKVKTNAAATLSLSCTQANPSTPVPVISGWNIISYLRTTPMSISTALSSLGSNIILVKNNAGQTYIPSMNINTIGNMIPGQGYQIKMAASGTLIYPP